MQSHRVRCYELTESWSASNDDTISASPTATATKPTHESAHEHTATGVARRAAANAGKVALIEMARDERGQLPLLIRREQRPYREAAAVAENRAEW